MFSTITEAPKLLQLLLLCSYVGCLHQGESLSIPGEIVTVNTLWNKLYMLSLTMINYRVFYGFTLYS